MTDTPFITIGITCFNAADLVHRAIESARSQTWPNFEILIVDDGSSDESLAVLEGFASRDDRLRVIRHEVNKGFPAALNTLFRNAQGVFVALFDDDDTSDKERLSKQYERLMRYEREHNTQKVLCYTGRLVFETLSMDTPSYTMDAIGHKSPEPYGSMVADYLLWSTGKQGFTWGSFGSGTMLVRRDFILELGGFDESFKRVAEWDLAVRAALEGAHFIAVNEPLLNQLKTVSSEKKGSIGLRYALKLRKKHKAYLKKLGPGYYWAALALAQARFAGSRGQKFRALLFRGLNYLCLKAGGQ